MLKAPETSTFLNRNQGPTHWNPFSGVKRLGDKGSDVLSCYYQVEVGTMSKLLYRRDSLFRVRTVSLPCVDSSSVEKCQMVKYR